MRGWEILYEYCLPFCLAYCQTVLMDCTVSVQRVRSVHVKLYCYVSSQQIQQNEALQRETLLHYSVMECYLLLF